MADTRERPTDMVLRWLAAHGHEYVGQWVALAEGEVVAAGAVRERVAAMARGTGRRVVLVEVGGRGEAPRELF
jgi:hypothetical protein